MDFSGSLACCSNIVFIDLAVADHGRSGSSVKWSLDLGGATSFSFVVAGGTLSLGIVLIASGVGATDRGLV